MQFWHYIYERLNFIQAILKVKIPSYLTSIHIGVFCFIRFNYNSIISEWTYWPGLKVMTARSSLPSSVWADWIGRPKANFLSPPTTKKAPDCHRSKWPLVTDKRKLIPKYRTSSSKLKHFWVLGLIVMWCGDGGRRVTDKYSRTHLGSIPLFSSWIYWASLRNHCDAWFLIDCLLVSLYWWVDK